MHARREGGGCTCTEHRTKNTGPKVPQNPQNTEQGGERVEGRSASLSPWPPIEPRTQVQDPRAQIERPSGGAIRAPPAGVSHVWGAAADRGDQGRGRGEGGVRAGCGAVWAGEGGGRALPLRAARPCSKAAPSLDEVSWGVLLLWAGTAGGPAPAHSHAAPSAPPTCPPAGEAG